MEKYVMLIPRGGFNDCLYVILRTIEYCKKYKRKLLLIMTCSAYKINFKDYFDINNPIMIYDVNLIRTIMSKKKYTVYPDSLNNKLIDILDIKIAFKYKVGGVYSYNNTKLVLPSKIVNEDIIMHSRCGGGDGFKLFKHLSFKDNIKDYCNQKLALLKNNKYLCIQIRNTDRKCNYQDLYTKNKVLIHSFNTIYIATDDALVIDFFKSKKLNIFNFNIFPEGQQCRSLHYSNVSSDLKIKCLICDILIATNSSVLLSNSKGGFINLIRKCFLNKKMILNKLKSDFSSPSTLNIL